MPPVELREALRRLHAASPEATECVEAHMDAMEAQILLHSSDDAFKAFVLNQAQQAGMVQSLLQRLDSTILSDLARVEVLRAETDLVKEKRQEAKALTTKQVLSQPVVLAFIGILSTILTLVGTLTLHFVGAS
jgi:hypothetical protein